MPPSVPRVGSFETIEDLVPRGQFVPAFKGDTSVSNRLVAASASTLAVDGAYSGTAYGFEGPATDTLLVSGSDGSTTATVLSSASSDFVAAGVSIGDMVQILTGVNTGAYEVSIVAVNDLTLTAVGGGAPGLSVASSQPFRVFEAAPTPPILLGFKKGDKIRLTAFTGGAGLNNLKEFTLVDPATITVFETVTFPDAGSSYDFEVLRRLG